MQECLDFDGHTYDRKRDGERLGLQLRQVKMVLADGKWWTLAQLSLMAGGWPESSISARIRDLRKPKFGGHTIEREFVHRGLWRYRMVA